MSLFRFILIEDDGTEHVVSDPKGWEDISVNITRHKLWHGVFFDYAIEGLIFYGGGAQLIMTEYHSRGIDGRMSLKIYYQCSDGETYDLFYFGRLSFDRYADSCGDECSVTIGLEDKNDVALIKNNYEQNININSLTSLDESTALNAYLYMNFNIEIPGRGIPITSAAHNDTDQSFDLLTFPQWGTIAGPGQTGTLQGATMPIFGNVTLAEFENTLINSAPYYDTGIVYNSGSSSKGTPPFFTIINNLQLKCNPAEVQLTIRVKGNLHDITNASRVVGMGFAIRVGKDPSNTVQVHSSSLFSYSTGVTDVTTPFDLTVGVTLTLQTGDNVYIFDILNYQKLSGAVLQFLILTYDTDCTIELTGLSECEPTLSKVYMVNEACSRITESITNGNIRFYSTFFGRKNSQPYALSQDTCAGLMSITNGLNIRRRLLINNTQPGFFLSLKKIFDDLRGIWNIGLGIETDIFRPTYNFLRLEDYRYFYRQEVGLIFNFATKINRSVDTSRVFNRMKTGYNKWQAGQNTGLYELMTSRNYNIPLNALSNELNTTTDLIGGSYTVEITRRQDVNTSDWQYDNDLFGFCVIPDSLEPTNYFVETFSTGSVTDVENVSDPTSCYNHRISPVRNAMRWFNVAMQGIRNLDANSKMIFTSADGNYIAKFGFNNCNIAAQPIAENKSIKLEDFDNIQDAKPLLFPELLTFTHPINYNTFVKIKNEPYLKYKKVLVKCNDSYTSGWIDTIKYSIKGMAEISVIPENNSQLPTPPPAETCEVSIVEGSIVTVDYNSVTGVWEVDFTEVVAGAAFWDVIVSEGSTPGSSTGTIFSFLTPTHPFQIFGISPGTWSLLITPYCEDSAGVNYATYTTELEGEEILIELSAVLTDSPSSNRLVLTANSNVVTDHNITFDWGHCVINTSIPSEYCVSYPGSGIPLPTNNFILANGTDTNTQNSAQVTPGESFGTITKIVLFNVVGISTANISKEIGQTWTLEFM